MSAYVFQAVFLHAPFFDFGTQNVTRFCAGLEYVTV